MALNYSTEGVLVCAHSGEFVTTHWSDVEAASQAESPLAAAALEHLCSHYWYPVYTYVRRQGRSIEDSQDLTQEFFARLLQGGRLRQADRNRGHFRTFLLTSLKHFLINEWKKASCQKRGGGCHVISLDTERTESRLAGEPVDGKSPDKAFAKQWALILLDRVLSELENEFTSSRRGGVFAELKQFLTGEDTPTSYATLGKRLGMTEGNLKVTVHRLKARYRDLLREEIARTVRDPQMVDDEIRELFAALSD